MLLLSPTTKKDAKATRAAPKNQSNVVRLNVSSENSSDVVYETVEYNVPRIKAIICGSATAQFKPASLLRRRVTAIVGSRVTIPSNKEIGPSLSDDRPNIAVSMTDTGKYTSSVNAAHHQYSALDEIPVKS
jgi:hypothetical protein